MKKTCFVLLCALLLGLAPTAFAAEEVGFGFGDLLNQLISYFLEPRLDADETSPAGDVPPNSSLATGDEPEMGWQIEPGG